MLEIHLRDMIAEPDSVESYNFYKSVEEWCCSNIERNRWRFDYSSAICVYGVDKPGRIIFWRKIDLVAFKLRFSCISAI
jgi:hypothetical protein